MSYDAHNIYYRFDDHLSRLVLDYEASRRVDGASERLYHDIPSEEYGEDIFHAYDVKRGLRNVDGPASLPVLRASPMSMATSASMGKSCPMRVI